MTQLTITPDDLLNEETYTIAIEKLEKQTGKQIEEVVLKNMVFNSNYIYSIFTHGILFLYGSYY